MWLKRKSNTIGLKASDTHVIAWYAGHDTECHFVMESIVFQWYEAVLQIKSTPVYWQNTFLFYSLLEDCIITADHHALPVTTSVKQNNWRIDRLEQDIMLITIYWKQSNIFVLRLKDYWKRYDDEKEWTEHVMEEECKLPSGIFVVFYIETRYIWLYFVFKPDISGCILC